MMAFSASALSQEQTRANEPLKPYQIPGSILHSVESKLVSQTYDLSVVLPESYTRKSKKNYPVVYVMDGQWNLSIIASISGKLHYDKHMGEAIIVGVTWGGKNPKAEVLRVRDFMPFAVPRNEDSGGASDFLQSMQDELIPYIEERYRTNSQRIITGSSLGGLFVTYAFFEKPKLFNSYVSSAGSLWAFPKGYIADKTEALKNSMLHKNTRFLIACGTLDGCVKSSTNLAHKLESLSLSRLNVNLQIVENLGHAGVEPVSYVYGLKWAKIK